MNKIYTLFGLVILAACAPNEVLFETLVEKNSITYKVNSQIPFTGSSIRRYRNGQLEFKINYKDGKKDGFTVQYDEAGELKFKGKFKDGLEHGPHESYYEN